ncbi:protein FAM3C-like, partial [Aplochiton taeniatus]
SAAPTNAPKCSLARKCPIDHFAFHIRSGAGAVVGPRICFDGRIVMSGLLNNVGPGLNIVQVNGLNGKVERSDYLNIQDGKQSDILTYLKNIKPEMIVLVTTFDDIATKITEEMREIFVGMGSTMIQSVKHRDNWVFAGATGTKDKSPFEKMAVSDPKTNVYEEWPEMVEVGGCFPRKLA